jgi:hypothetical protein
MSYICSSPPVTNTVPHKTRALKITDYGTIARILTVITTSATLKTFFCLLMSSCHLAVVHLSTTHSLPSSTAYTPMAVTRRRNHAHIFLLLLWLRTSPSTGKCFIVVWIHTQTHMSTGLRVFWDQEYIPNIKHKLVCFHSYSFTFK